ncbi:Strictosidine synthase 1 [Acorus calamus]|uniref:Strictosidine synthase 1 n=1 Tax=Acorus calamus TaxID=4465 RepID=A0AAV9EK53_ACOCL|nr:Strictosidine synthase 1 [Acorus calamus]
MASLRTALGGFVLVCLIGITIQLLLRSPICPVPLELPTTSPELPPPNDALQKGVKLGEGMLEGPEDVWVDKEGTLYTATRDGWIKRMHLNDSWEDWAKIDGGAALGITASASGGLIACDPVRGLLKVGEHGVTIIANEVDDGSKINFADAAIEASDGGVYFSDVSTKFGFQDWIMDILEARPHGRLLRYDPSTNETSIVLSDLAFANGVALSADEDYLVVCETWKFRCLRYWLKGEVKGKAEVFIDNLPGGPDNINLAPDGSFWIALLKLRSRWLDVIHRSPMIKRLIGASFPGITSLPTTINSRATIVNVGGDGKIIRRFDDPNGSVMRFLTSAVEYEGHLYLGSLSADFIGKLSLLEA